MVHLHNGAQPVTLSSDLIFAKTPAATRTTSDGQTTSTGANASQSSSNNSFARQLETEIEGRLAQFENGSQFETAIQNGEGQGGNQRAVKVNDLTGGGTTRSSATSTTSASGTSASGTSATTSGASSSSSSSSNSSSADIGTTSLGGPAGISAAQLAQMTPDEAYWAEQPPAVQALQNMPADQREAAAEGLAAQGYSIDVPIMVWGWDPLTTMVERQNYGYTWVPSGDQPNLPLPPGVSVPGLANYNPADAPPGSILVTTAFANGTNGQDPYVQWPPASTSNS